MDIEAWSKKTKPRKSYFVEIEFSSRGDGTEFKEFEINDLDIRQSIEDDCFMTLDFLERNMIDVCSVANYEKFDYCFIDRIAIAIQKSGISAEKCRDFLLALKDVEKYIWKFGSVEREDFILNIWQIKNKSYNEGASAVLDKINPVIEKALEPTTTSIRLSERKELAALEQKVFERMLLIFDKESDNKWYVRLDDWTGPKEALEMVCGADTFLDILAQGDDSVRFKVSNVRPNDLDYAMKFKSDESGGGIYGIHDSEDSFMFDCWLCEVTKFVFDGHLPKTIYVTL